MRTCQVEGCERKHEAHGFCAMHYKRMKAHGDPQGHKPGKPYVGRTRDQVERRIRENVRITENGCWEWTLALTAQGYSALKWGHMLNGHRVSYTVFVGPVTEGMSVLHRCDNPPCVNPAHLFLGTLADNNADMDAKGRANRIGLSAGRDLCGEDHPNAKLTEESVRAIRQSSEPLRVMAARYGVSLMTVSKARNRKTWTHID